jgi:uncharacterized protein (DUF427 family)
VPKAIWNDEVIAEAEQTEVVEGNHYFPQDSLSKQYFPKERYCQHVRLEGTAHYYTIDVDGSVNPDAAWYYPDPKPAAANIAGKVAFWKGVKVVC